MVFFSSAISGRFLVKVTSAESAPRFNETNPKTSVRLPAVIPTVAASPSPWLSVALGAKVGCLNGVGVGLAVGAGVGQTLQLPV